MGYFDVCEDSPLHPLESDMQLARNQILETSTLHVAADLDAAAVNLHEQQHFPYSPPPQIKKGATWKKLNVGGPTRDYSQVILSWSAYY